MERGIPTNSGEECSAEEYFSESAPSISLPKGGGTVRGIGEKFAANPVTGTGSMTVPIATSSGRSGLAHNYLFLMTQVLVMAHSVLVGVFRTLRLRVKQIKGYHVIGIPKNRMSSSFQGQRIWFLFLLRMRKING